MTERSLLGAIAPRDEDAELRAAMDRITCGSPAWGWEFRHLAMCAYNRHQHGRMDDAGRADIAIVLRIFTGKWLRKYGEYA